MKEEIPRLFVGPYKYFPFVLSFNLAPISDPLWYQDDDRGYRFYSLISLYFVKLTHGHGLTLYFGPLAINFAWGVP